MYIEYLSFYNIIFLIYNFFVKKINLRHKTVFYIDRTFSSIIISKILNYFFETKFQYLNFKMINIKDDNNELLRLRIFIKDLKELRTKIVKNHDIFREIKQNTKFNHFYSYLFKKLATGHMSMDPDSLVPAVFLIQVAVWHSKKNNISNVSLYMSNRSWFEELKEYAREYNINLYKTPQLRKHRKKKNLYYFNIGQSNFPLLFNIIIFLNKYLDLIILL